MYRNLYYKFIANFLCILSLYYKEIISHLHKMKYYCIVLYYIVLLLNFSYNTYNKNCLIVCKFQNYAIEFWYNLPYNF